ncbi:MAG: LysM peptidoglycan-binding domain-containing protein [Planctomycetia bacterium]
MPSRANTVRRRRESGSDSLEALKPALVLGLLGMILYGAYMVVQKGSKTASLDEAPAFTSGASALELPQVDLPPVGGTAAAAPRPAAAPPLTPPAPQPTYLSAIPGPPPASGDVPTTTAPIVPPPAPLTVAPPSVPPAMAEANPVEAAPAALAVAAAAPVATASAPAAGPSMPVPSPFAAASTAVAPSAGGRASAFSTAWADAHDKLSAGRYAEALAVLSVWYDDPTLGLEESQRLEELLGQLAGTVIYSPEDLLLPPHIVAPGETLPTIASTMAIPWQLIGKINGVDDPASLVPGEALKVVRGPFDAVVSLSRRRLSLQLAGNYAGSFPVVIGRRIQERVGTSLAVADVQRAAAGRAGAASQVSYFRQQDGSPAIILGDGLRIESADDPVAASDAAPEGSLVVSARDLAELADILGPGSNVLIRQ